MPALTLRRHAAALFGYLCVAVAFLWPVPLRLGDVLPGPPGSDTGVYVWNLWVFRHEIVEHGRLPFFTFEILALTPPVPLVLHNYTTFANILAFPILPILGVVATYNVLILVALVVTAYAMFVCAARYTNDAAAAWIGGLLFGFSPFMSARATEHFSLLLAAPIPVFACLLQRVAKQPGARLAAAAGVVVAWAFLCDPYYAVYCLLMAGFMGVHALMVVDLRPAEVRRRRWMALLDFAILCLAGLIVGILLRGGGQIELFGLSVSVTRLYNPVMVLTVLVALRVWLAVRPRIVWVLPPLKPYLGAAIVAAFVCAVLLAPVLYAVGSPFGESQWISPRVPWRSSAPGVDLLALLLPNPTSGWLGAGADWLRRLPNGFAENVASIPWVAIGVLAVVFWRYRYRPPMPWVAFTGFFLLLSLGPFVRVAGQSTFVPGPWALLRYLPIVGAARMPTRITVLMMFGVAMMLAFAVGCLRSRSRRGTAVTVAVSALLLIELLPGTRPVYSAIAPEAYRVIAADPRPLRVMTLPFGLRDGLSSRGNFSAAYQFYQTVHEKPLVGGYLSRLPKGSLAKYRRNQVMRALLRLSEGRYVEPPLMDAAFAGAHDVIADLQVGWVVVDTEWASPELQAFARRAFDLTPVVQGERFELYRTPLAGPQ